MMKYLQIYLPKLIYWKKATWTRSQWFCYDYMKMFLKYRDKNTYKAIGQNNNIKFNDIIWIYWRQGEINAPQIVKKCINSIKEHAGNHQVIILNEQNLSQYIIMPDFIQKKYKQGKIKDALYSDLLRISLLIEYGGYWCDATCLLVKPFAPIIEHSNFFMFNKDLLTLNTTPCECSSWFIKANKDDILLIKLRNILFHYFKSHSWLPDYYIFHITLGLLIHTDKEIAEIWNNKPYICNMNPHVLLFSLKQIYNSEKFKHIINSCFIHKLTYKFKNVERGSILEFILTH